MIAMSEIGLEISGLLGDWLGDFWPKRRLACSEISGAGINLLGDVWPKRRLTCSEIGLEIGLALRLVASAI